MTVSWTAPVSSGPTVFIYSVTDSLGNTVYPFSSPTTFTYPGGQSGPISYTAIAYYDDFGVSVPSNVAQTISNSNNGKCVTMP